MNPYFQMNSRSGPHLSKDPSLVEALRIDVHRPLPLLVLVDGALIAVVVVIVHNLDGAEILVQQPLLGRQQQPELPAQRFEAHLADLVETMGAASITQVMSTKHANIATNSLVYSCTLLDLPRA